MARYSKKHAREVRRDRVRESTLGLFERLGDRLEGRGALILYGLGGLLALGLLAFVFSIWRESKADDARQAMGRAIEIASAEVTASPAPNTTGPVFATEQERARRAAEEFKRVADKHGEPYRSQASYLRATNLLSFDRPAGIAELETLTKSGDESVAAWAKFALAQAREADAQYDAAATLYRELASAREPRIVPEDTARLRLAAVLEKQGKKEEAAELLFQIVKAAREAKDKDGKPVTPTSSARDAEDRLQKLDPARHSQLPPAPLASGLPS